MAWQSLIAVLTFSLCTYLLHAALKSVLLDDEVADLEGKVAVVKRFIAETRSEGELPVLKRHLDATSIGGRFRWNVWIVRPDDALIYGVDEAPSHTVRSDGRLLIRRSDGLGLRGTSFSIEDGGPIAGATVFIGMDPRPRAQMLERFDLFSAVICGFGLIATVSCSIVATRRGLAPIALLSRHAENIKAGALSVRMPLPGERSELQPLVLRLNEALERVEDAWKRLEAFSADVAHELRTPLSVMTSGAEVALSRARTAEELRDVMEMQLEDLRGMSAMVNDMLFLAKADSGDVPDPLETISLRHEVQTAAEYVEVLTTERQQTLVLTGDCEVRASATLVRRATVNLLLNAIRHAPDGGDLQVDIAVAEAEATVTVSNPGPPIAVEDQRRMFDRFWRGDTSRAKAGDRSGLGLAIVRAVAMMHGGRTFVACSHGRTSVGFSVRLELTDPPTGRLSATDNDR